MPRQELPEVFSVQRALYRVEVSFTPKMLHSGVVVLVHEAGRLERAAVHNLRTAGFSWREIGKFYKMSPQAAQQRFGRTP